MGALNCQLFLVRGQAHFRHPYRARYYPLEDTCNAKNRLFDRKLKKYNFKTDGGDHAGQKSFLRTE